LFEHRMEGLAATNNDVHKIEMTPLKDSSIPAASPPSEASVTNNSRSTPRFVYICAFLASMSSLNTGWDIGIIATAIIYIEADLNINDSQIQLMIAIANFFAIIGSFLGGQCAHRFGRKKIMVTSAVLSCFAVLLMAFTSDFNVILLSRCVNGMCIGMSLLVTPMYIAEIAPSHIRGAIVSVNEIFLNLGHVFGYIMAFLLHYYKVDVSLSWRLMVGSGSIISFLLMVSMLFMPESPRWLCQNGLESAARFVLRKTYDSKEAVDEMIHEMKETNRSLAEHEVGWKEIIFPCFFKPDVALWRALLIAAPLGIFSQLCGHQAFVYYVPRILQEHGWNTQMVFVGTIMIGASKLLTSVLVRPWIDRVGRRVLLLVSALSMALWIGALGVVTHFADGLDHSESTVIVLLMCITGSFSIGYGPITWLLNSELFAVNVRSKAMGYCTVLNRLAAAFVTFTFFSLESAMSEQGVYYLYAALGFCFSLFIFQFVPETKSRSLEEITKSLMN